MIQICAKCGEKTNCLKCDHNNQWVSLKDKLPPEKMFHSIFIVTIFSHTKSKQFVDILNYIGGEWFTMYDEESLDSEYEVTHWQPLPEPPK